MGKLTEDQPTTAAIPVEETPATTDVVEGDIAEGNVTAEAPVVDGVVAAPTTETAFEEAIASEAGLTTLGNLDGI